MIDGEMVEPPEEDVKTCSSFCGCCPTFQEPNTHTEDIVLAVIHEQKVEAELVEPPDERILSQKS